MTSSVSRKLALKRVIRKEQSRMGMSAVRVPCEKYRVKFAISSAKHNYNVYAYDRPNIMTFKYSSDIFKTELSMFYKHNRTCNLLLQIRYDIFVHSFISRYTEKIL